MSLGGRADGRVESGGRMEMRAKMGWAGICR